ncbi:4454_t:CDS:2 [Entrophospora sp. SA101]|nr:9916_t:CDS:2 [Entrophospora sp. SA101]CAJ0825151.1 5099_t:CDS:2 [Entrophospora sp. SA101]CAJ0829981.1 4454_t:CDS:2 [Entrophospora sp. SA101]
MVVRTTSSQSGDSYMEDGYIHNMTFKQAKNLLESPRSRQVITLASCGKKVGVCEVGDPNGFPVLWFTGNMGPALSIVLYHYIAKKHHIRLVCVDRPGYNDSDDIYSTPGVPNLFEFAEMINELTLILRMWQFGLATFSLGAVYGLAYSLLFPERISGPIFMVSPWVSTSVPGTSTMYKGIAKFAPNFLIRTGLSNLPNFLNLWGTLGGSNASPSTSQSSSTSFYSSSPSSRSSSTSVLGVTNDDDNQNHDLDPANIENIDNIDDLLFSISPGRSFIHNQIYQNGLWNLQNRTGAHIDALVALEKVDWGFKYEETTYPIQAYVGDVDDNVPINAWMYMSNRMNNINMEVIEGGGHYLLYRMDFMDNLFKTIQRTCNKI